MPKTRSLSIEIATYSILLSLVCAEPVLAHGESIITVGAVFFAYQFSLALALFNARKLTPRRLVALGCYVVGLGVLWETVIFTNLEIFSLTYLLLTFGIPLIVAGGVYIGFRSRA